LGIRAGSDPSGCRRDPRRPPRRHKPRVVALLRTARLQPPCAQVALKVIRLQEQEDSSSGLVADACRLGWTVRPSQQQGGAGGARRAQDDPALAAAERRVFAQLEAEGLREEGDCFVIVCDQETDEGQMLLHRLPYRDTRGPEILA